ncbi:MAG: hypothetical protein V3T02_02160 [Alphaproteobacteria bacterium]
MMSHKHSSRNCVAQLRRIGTAAIAALTLAACANNGALIGEGIGFREARFEQISLMREYRKCRDQGFELDRKARNSGSTGTYLASAQVLEKCEASIGTDGNGIARDERMRAVALSVQNYFKGGDVEHSRNNFDKFKGKFPDHDLYYPDGSSFIVTMDALLGRKEHWTFGEFSALNVNSTLKGEMRRMLYWKNK